jgi:cell division protein FtsI/penicillin-binding protein 2
MTNFDGPLDAPDAPEIERETLKTITGKTSTAEKFKALIDASEHFDSDLTQFIGYDQDKQVLFACVFAQGSYAAPLAKFLKRLAKQEDRKAK